MSSQYPNIFFFSWKSVAVTLDALYRNELVNDMHTNWPDTHYTLISMEICSLTSSYGEESEILCDNHHPDNVIYTMSATETTEEHWCYRILLHCVIHCFNNISLIWWQTIILTVYLGTITSTNPFFEMCLLTFPDETKK